MRSHLEEECSGLSWRGRNRDSYDYHGIWDGKNFRAHRSVELARALACVWRWVSQLCTKTSLYCTEKRRVTTEGSSLDTFSRKCLWSCEERGQELSQVNRYKEILWLGGHMSMPEMKTWGYQPRQRSRPKTKWEHSHGSDNTGNKEDTMQGVRGRQRPATLKTREETTPRRKEGPQGLRKF